MSLNHIAGMVMTLAVMLLISIASGKASKVKKGAGSLVVSGAIMGTLVGGSSTVGTAQLAYQYGMSAWWFTLGSGIACLILALFYAKSLRNSGNKTLAEFITNEYGKKNGVIASVFSSLGSFINIISQIISATAIIAVVLPRLSVFSAIVFSSAFMILYVVFGGTKGSGITGIVKMLLIYLSIIVAGIMVVAFSNGINGFKQLVNSIENPSDINFFSLFARGAGDDLGACLSLVLGVITTQSYAQAIFMAKGTKQAVKGALMSAVLIPPVGIGGILVGLYMRAVHPGIMSKTALTLFVTEYMPPLAGGVVLGVLFIAVAGTGAGLALGIATNIKNDILPYFKNKLSDNTTEKILVVLILGIAAVLSSGPLGDTILKFAFMSMALRGATIFVPLNCAIRLKNKIPDIYAGCAIVAGPLTVLVFQLVKILPFDPLFAGVGISALIMLAGGLKKKLE